jgi:hypothetical protein
MPSRIGATVVQYHRRANQPVPLDGFRAELPARACPDRLLRSIRRKPRAWLASVTRPGCAGCARRGIRREFAPAFLHFRRTPRGRRNGVRARRRLEPSPDGVAVLRAPHERRAAESPASRLLLSALIWLAFASRQIWRVGRAGTGRDNLHTLRLNVSILPGNTLHQYPQSPPPIGK